ISQFKNNWKIFEDYLQSKAQSVVPLSDSGND
ncbi:unnamed protein product, partial [marine sediment metagenome]